MNNSNGDTNRIWHVDSKQDGKTTGKVAVRGLGSFHKTLPHNEFGEVDPAAFAALVSATRGDGSEFSQVPTGPARVGANGEFHTAAVFTNPQGGLATDQLTHPPQAYMMPPAPRVNSNTTAAEMVELYWMAIFRDADVCAFDKHLPIPQGSKIKVPAGVGKITLDDAVNEINGCFSHVIGSPQGQCDYIFKKKVSEAADGESDRFILGSDIPGPDIPGSGDKFKKFTAQTLFRLGLPGDDAGPMISQFFLRPAAYGTQTIDQRQRPYATFQDYLTAWTDWLAVQNTGKDVNDQSYSRSNEADGTFFDGTDRYIATMRDLARFVNKDALHQAYFNATLILLSGGAKWGIGNPYHDLMDGVVQGTLPSREAGFGVLGGPHILALVSEVATRALKIVWNQKWQQHLRLRPEAYGGLVHVQNAGVGDKNEQRNYGLPEWLANTKAAKIIKESFGGYLLPMAFTAGSPTHPAYGAGHATVAGACVTILKAWFLTFTQDADGTTRPVDFNTLTERENPFGKGEAIQPYCAKRTLANCAPLFNREKYEGQDCTELTIEGELNKLAQNVAMGRSMGGVHWRTDNTRSLMLGEAIAAELLADITTDSNEKPFFTFRSFSRRADGQPKVVLVKEGRIFVDGVERQIPASLL